MRVLHLYRPRLPSLRAQSVQVLHACHALARRGHRVTLLADRGAPDASARSALDGFGLPSLEDVDCRGGSLDLRIAPGRHPGLAGAWFRAQVLAWWAGPRGVVLARDKRRLAGFLGLPSRHKVVIETHELDSALLREQGCEGAPMVRLETRVLAGADGLVANCGGTLDAWREAHGDALPELQLACHNATSASRHRDPHPDPDPVVRCLGSARSFKGAGFYLGAAPSLPLPLEWIGASDQEQARFDSPESGVRLLPAVPYRRVPDVLARSQVLLLPLEDNLFGRSLTSPLKLWDYLATCAPIVAPDLPSVREIAAMIAVPLHLHAPGDVAGLADAVTRAMAAPTRAPHLRTWDRRAAELEAVLQQAGAGP